MYEPAPQPDRDDRLPTDEDQRPDPVVDWRYKQLCRAGYGPVLAHQMSMRRDIDLHRAMDLCASAGPEAAFDILW